MTRRLAIAAFVYIAALAPAWAGDLTVTVTGVRNATGSVVAALFDSDGGFPKAPQAAAAFRMKAREGSFSVTFHNLPAGNYAALAYHDENDNGKLDTDEITGVPSEGYGVSNGAREVAGPPQFAKAAFAVGGDAKSISVELKY